MTKVIFLITFSPKYEQFSNQPRPAYNWTNKNGKWGGIWGLDWGDLACQALVKNYEDYDCEVWQPDLRAEIIHSVQFNSRFSHSSFPAVMRTVLKRGRLCRELQSPVMLDHARSMNRRDFVVMVPATVYTHWLGEFIACFPSARFLHYNFLNSQKMLPELVRTPHPLKYLNRLLLEREKRHWMSRVKNLLTSNDNPGALAKLHENYPGMNIFLFKQGMDLQFWQATMSRSEAKAKLGIPDDDYAIVLSQRLVPEYQVDKLITVVSRIRANRPFRFYISGHGLREYEAYLAELARQHNVEDKIRFLGFIPDEELRDYMIAADLFATLAVYFAGSAGAKKAMALGTPVLHVTSGSTYEFLRRHGAGEFVDPKDYDSWVTVFQELISGQPVKTVPRAIIEDYFTWKGTAEEIHQAIQNSD